MNSKIIKIFKLQDKETGRWFSNVQELSSRTEHWLINEKQKTKVLTASQLFYSMI